MRFAACILLYAVVTLSGCQSTSTDPPPSSEVTSAHDAAVQHEAESTSPHARSDTMPSVEDPVATPPAADDPVAAPIAEPPARILSPFAHVEVHMDDRAVLFDGLVCGADRWLEQVVCIDGTRTHESLVVSLAKPSHIHAALLMVEFEPGEPGKWNYDNNTITITPPKGDPIEIEVMYQDAEGEWITVPIREWIIDDRGDIEFPNEPWVFSGSTFAEAPESWGGGEIYVADYSGSVAGLVTFGDELLGFSKVLSDDESLEPPRWVMNQAHMPPPGTPVTVILRAYDEDE